MKEGGYVNDPADPGGETNYGISKRAFPNEDMTKLTLARAKVLYKKHYWDKCEGDSLPGWVRLMVFDCAVNQGVTRAVVFMQRILLLPQDGIAGPVTIAALDAVSAKDFLTEYTLRRFDAYKSHPQWVAFGKGWMQRLFEISLMSIKNAPNDDDERTVQ